MNSIVISDDGHLVKFDCNIINQIFQYRQTNSNDKEAGGVLIARELKYNENLIIEEMTVPQEMDKRSRFKFERKDIAHVQYFQALYEKSEATYGYFGEWHTHPQNVPVFSVIDRRHWMKIYNDLPEKHGVYFVIAGIEAIGIWKVDLTVSRYPVKVYGSKWEKI